MLADVELTGPSRLRVLVLAPGALRITHARPGTPSFPPDPAWLPDLLACRDPDLPEGPLQATASASDDGVRVSGADGQLILAEAGSPDFRRAVTLTFRLQPAEVRLMHVIALDTQNRRDKRRFLDLPFTVYRDIPQWVPPLEIDARRMLDHRRHPFYRHSEAGFFLALDDASRPVGRLAVLHNRPFNAFNHQRTAFFYLFECLEEPDAAQALFEAAFDWARARGLARIQGPKGFSALDGTGFLVAGFEHRPALGIPYNPPYYPRLVEAAGFEPLDEVVSGYLDARSPFPEAIHRASELIQKRRGLRVARFRTRRDLRAFVPRLQSLYNASLAGTVDNTPLSDEDAKAMAQQMLWFANPRLIKVLMKGDAPVGFLFAYPDISAALQRTRGRLWPLGWADMLVEMRRTRWVNINGAAIVERYRGLGGTAILFSEMQRSVVEGGFLHADLVQVGLANDRMQRELRDLGIVFYKRHRSYARAL